MPALESGSEAGAGKVYVSEKIKAIFCKGPVKENRNSKKYGLRPKNLIFFCSKFFRFQNVFMIFFVKWIEVVFPYGANGAT